MQPEIPPAVALSDNIPVVDDDNDEYDSYGNYVGGDQSKIFLNYLSNQV